MKVVLEATPARVAVVAPVVPVVEAVIAVGVVVVALVGYCELRVKGTDPDTAAGPSRMIPGESVARVVLTAAA